MRHPNQPKRKTLRTLSIHERIIRIISFNKFVKFWFRCVAIFDSIYVHIIMTVLGFYPLVSLFYVQFVFFFRPWHRIVTQFMQLFIACFGFINTISCLRRRKVLRKYELQTQLILNTLNEEDEFGKFQRILFMTAAYQLLCFIFMFSSTLIDIETLLLPGFEFLIDHVVWVLFYFYMNFYVVHFLLHISLIGKCYIGMKKVFGAFRNERDIQRVILTRFVGYHDVLIEACKGYCDFFGLLNFITLGYFVLSTIFQMHFIILGASDEKEYNTIASQFAFQALMTGSGFLLIAGCTTIEMEAEKFNEALASLCLRDKTGTLVTNPLVTAHFTIGKKLKLSAGDCFNIDYRLGYSMLAACITYLVILVQYVNKEVVREAPLDSTTLLPT